MIPTRRRASRPLAFLAGSLAAVLIVPSPGNGATQLLNP